MFLAKTALDQEGKKKPPYIAHCDYKDVPTKLWGIEPITKIWGISNGTANHLARIGIHNLKDLALTPLSFLEKEFGLMGYQLHDMANGLDGSDIQEVYVPKDSSLTLGQTLIRDYRQIECRLLLREMTDELCARLREKDLQTGRISLCLGGVDSGWYQKQRKLPIHTDSPSYLYDAITELLDEGPILNNVRHISIAFSSLEESAYQQMTFFDRTNEERNLWLTMDAIKARYGKNSISRCSALQEHSTIRQRNEQIGGHRR